ncbi:hypothetical protein BCR36DRAFT_413245 [Piromyces finnis]|uniref:Uncharacterized protein n=1 Tax=Piromyces finnis TaxID=1754191 RepID=A0A1Y1V743_9FUNG|nr:hypothetical protein BCR36DRAFT_413245 [Piromyces finnis]|eukprot:ORX48094.1 hypothetical protein BCR36DRAFT_413245 [Piromyces finnis]
MTPFSKVVSACNLAFVNINVLRIICFSIDYETFDFSRKLFVSLYALLILSSGLLCFALVKDNIRMMYLFEYIYVCYIIAKVFLNIWSKIYHFYSVIDAFFVIGLLIATILELFFPVILFFHIKEEEKNNNKRYKVEFKKLDENEVKKTSEEEVNVKEATDYETVELESARD